MPRVCMLIRFSVVLFLLALFPGQAVCSDSLYQVSVIDALLAGDYDGDVSIGELKRHGDFGLGTFNGLDGEMVVLGGTVYKVEYNGTVKAMPDGELTPFAAVVKFQPDTELELGAVADFSALKAKVDASLETENLFYAVRVHGLFKSVKTRSVPKQQKPYPPLAQVVKKQSIFQFSDIDGTLIGMRCPVFVKGMNVPGWHWHFISDDRKSGGHVLECSFEGLKAEIDAKNGFAMVLPETASYFGLDFSGDRSKELHKVEKDPAAKKKDE